MSVIELIKEKGLPYIIDGNVIRIIVDENFLTTITHYAAVTGDKPRPELWTFETICERNIVIKDNTLHKNVYIERENNRNKSRYGELIEKKLAYEKYHLLHEMVSIDYLKEHLDLYDNYPSYKLFLQQNIELIITVLNSLHINNIFHIGYYISASRGKKKISIICDAAETHIRYSKRKGNDPVIYYGFRGVVEDINKFFSC